VAEERARGSRAARDRRRREAVGAQLRDVPLEIVDRRPRDRLAEERAERGEIARVRLDRARRAPRREQREEAVDRGIALVHACPFALARTEPAVEDEDELRTVDDAYHAKCVDPASGAEATIFVDGDLVFRVVPRLVMTWAYATCSSRTDFVRDD
jgi:hypothetical protein